MPPHLVGGPVHAAPAPHNTRDLKGGGTGRSSASLQGEKYWSLETLSWHYILSDSTRNGTTNPRPGTQYGKPVLYRPLPPLPHRPSLPVPLPHLYEGCCVCPRPQLRYDPGRELAVAVLAPPPSLTSAEAVFAPAFSCGPIRVENSVSRCLSKSVSSCFSFGSRTECTAASNAVRVAARSARSRAWGREEGRGGGAKRGQGTE